LPLPVLEQHRQLEESKEAMRVLDWREKDEREGAVDVDDARKRARQCRLSELRGGRRTKYWGTHDALPSSGGAVAGDRDSELV